MSAQVPLRSSADQEVLQAIEALERALHELVEGSVRHARENALRVRALEDRVAEVERELYDQLHAELPKGGAR